LMNSLNHSPKFVLFENNSFALLISEILFFKDSPPFK